MNCPGWQYIGRGIFFVAVVGFGWWGLEGRGADIFTAILRVGPLVWLPAFIFVLLGLTATGLVWARLLRAYGHTIPLPQSMSMFFVGQLGKYIPGSVWSLGAQAQMANRYHVPVRTSVATGLVFLIWNLSTATLMGFAAVLSGALKVAMPPWLLILSVLLNLIGLAPPVVNWFGTRLAGPRQRLRLRWSDCVNLLLTMGLTWTFYGLALLMLATCDGPECPSLGLSAASGAFAIAYIVGVLIILAPAGVGAREVTLALLLAPELGVASAVVIGLLMRVIHTLSDFTIAGFAWIIARLTEKDCAHGAGNVWEATPPEEPEE